MFFAFVFHQSLTHTKDINQSSLKHYCMGRILDFSCQRQSRNITLSEIDRRPHFIKFHSTVFKKKMCSLIKEKDAFCPILYDCNFLCSNYPQIFYSFQAINILWKAYRLMKGRIGWKITIPILFKTKRLQTNGNRRRLSSKFG